jgi:hypothetical protein
MQSLAGNSTNGTWDYDIPPQLNGTTIYFAIFVFDNSGLNSSYPSTVPFSRPQSILIEYPSEAYLSSVVININSLTITDVQQQANVSVQMVAYLPSVPDKYYILVAVLANGYGWIPNLGLNELGSRFYYQGQTSSIVYLSGGSTGQIPYDTYTLNLTLTIPYKFDNLTYAISRSSIYLLSSSGVYNSWNVPLPRMSASISNSQTSLSIETTLSRRTSAFYPPIVLMLVALGVLGLVPLVSVYYHEKRYELFLNVIILASSAELSQTINPATDFRGDNIFLQGFAAIMVAAVVMMAISSLPPKVREWSHYGLQLEWYTTIAIAVLTFLWVWFTKFPMTAKLLTLFAGLSGVIIIAFCRLPRAYVRYRLRQWLGR